MLVRARRSCISSPCTRRDGPVGVVCDVDVEVFSLHAQGWPARISSTICRSSVLPARAGMALSVRVRSQVLHSSPCTRRDGPDCKTFSLHCEKFSLHAQGWPGNCVVCPPMCRVLPAGAGMALPAIERKCLKLRSPCTRRDGPQFVDPTWQLVAFSLHAQGWPFWTASGIPTQHVLPARAGMALHPDHFAGHQWGSPCTRRDGPSTGDGSPHSDVFSLHAQGWP